MLCLYWCALNAFLSGCQKVRVPLVAEHPSGGNHPFRFGGVILAHKLQVFNPVIRDLEQKCTNVRQVYSAVNHHLCSFAVDSFPSKSELPQ